MTNGRPERKWLAALPVLVATLAPAAAGGAETSPVFVPGLYEIETRSAAVPDRGPRKTQCLASADAAAFQRDTLARYGALPQFKAVCRLSEPKPLPDGFAFAMDCGTSKTVLTYRLAKDLVRAIVETSIPGRPANGSTLLTLSRRVGNCR